MSDSIDRADAKYRVLRTKVSSSRAELMSSLTERLGGQLTAQETEALLDMWESKDALATRSASTPIPSAPDGGLRILSATELENLPPPSWLIDDLIADGSLATLYGPPGVGKSFLCLDMAASVSAGIDWHGHTTRQGNVVYIIAEGLGDFGQRVRAFREARMLASLPEMMFVLEAINLFDRQGGDLLLDVVASLDPVLIVFDTLARSMAGGDENSAKDMGLVIETCDYMRREIGVAVLLVHHTGKDKKGERGSSALLGAVDTMMKLEEADAMRGRGGLHLVCKKQKYAAEFPDHKFRLLPDEISVTVVGTDITSAERLCLELVSGTGDTNKQWLDKFVAAELGAKSTFLRRVKSLESKGIVVKQGEGKGAPYQLTDKGTKELA